MWNLQTQFSTWNCSLLLSSSKSISSQRCILRYVELLDWWWTVVVLCRGSWLIKYAPTRALSFFFVISWEGKYSRKVLKKMDEQNDCRINWSVVNVNAKRSKPTRVPSFPSFQLADTGAFCTRNKWKNRKQPGLRIKQMWYVVCSN